MGFEGVAGKTPWWVVADGVPYSKYENDCVRV